ncbi:histidine kinase dimerization/phospho-acceptor domain-containing protein [Haloferula chungangensis]|uniref:histidine kinase n=1 Tax=Haloferula chungangensis TaxID=1048331 RepID=A0ABW2L381_9BACT
MEPDEHKAISSSIAHDLRTPLTGIRMMLQLLMEQKVGELNEKQLFMVNQAKDDCERLVDVIARLVAERDGNT